MQQVEVSEPLEIVDAPAQTETWAHYPMQFLKAAAGVLLAALLMGLVVPLVTNYVLETLYHAQVRRRLPLAPLEKLTAFEGEHRARQAALEFVDEQLLDAAYGRTERPVSELLQLHEHLAKLDQQKPPVVVVGYYLDDSMPLWPLYFAGLGWLSVLLAPGNITAPSLPTRAVWSRAGRLLPFVWLFYRWPTWFRNFAQLGDVDRKVYAYANWDIHPTSFLVQELMGVIVSAMIAVVWVQWLSFFERRDLELHAQQHADTQLEIDTVRVERLQNTFLHWQVSSIFLGIAFLYSTFFFWARVAQDGDVRYIPNALVTHLLWVASWLILSAPLFITWRDWTQYRGKLLASIANRPEASGNCDAMLEVVEKLHPVSFWNLSGSTVLGLASLVLPIAHSLVH
jgi:hypothetical protein